MLPPHCRAHFGCRSYYRILGSGGLRSAFGMVLGLAGLGRLGAHALLGDCNYNRINSVRFRMYSTVNC